MIAATLMTLAIVTQDQASLRAAPRDSAVQQAALWQGDTLEIRGQRMDYLQVYDHRRERAGFIHLSQVRQLSIKPSDAPELLTVVRFLRDSPGAESLGMGYTAAYLKAAPAGAIGAEAFDALGTMAERLARRAAMKHPKAVSDIISAHMEVASFYGVTFKAYERDGSMQLCYEGEAFRRVLSLPSDAEQRGAAVLALTRHECMATDLHPQARLALDQSRANLLDRVSVVQWAQLPSVTKNRLHLRRAGVQASLAFQLARRGESPVLAAQRALTDLASVDKSELTDADLQEYSDTAIRVGASRWAADTTPAPAAPLTLVTEAGQAGETCLVVRDNRAAAMTTATVTTTTTATAAKRSGEAPTPLVKRCTYGVVWAASASVHPNGQTLTVAVQPLDAWRELWVIRQIAGQWTVDVLPPSSSNPELGYVEFAGWGPASSNQAAHMLLARETWVAGRSKRSFEVMRIDTLKTEKQASDPSLLLAFGRGQDARWKRQTVSLR